MAIQIGQQAPDFTLVNTEKNPVSLSSFKGQNVVLLFFPLAFSSVCTAELCNVRDEMARYNSLDATVIGISIDSLFTLAKFKEDQQYNFELLSGFNKEVSAAYGALYDEFFGMKGVSKRAAFVIDREGVMRYAEVLEDAGQKPNFTQILRTLGELPLTV